MFVYFRYRRRLERERYYTQGIELPRDKLRESMSTTQAPAPTSQGGKLAQEIHDEFLTCKICLEGFKSPKCLDCLHTFCEQCIDNHVMSECTYKKYSDYREFTCPLCRKRTALPIGGVKKLPDNFLVSSLGELVARQRPSKFPFCDICKLVNRKHREASSKCLDCNKLLCKQCVDMHKETKVTKNHSLFDCEIEKDIECKEHKEEVVRFYCEPCESCICVLCTFNEHKDHEITQFSDAVVKYKECIQTLLDSCKDRINIYDSQLGLLGKCETTIKETEQNIRDVAIQFISEIRNREKQLIDNLHEIYGKELMEYVARRSEMQINLDSLKSTCSLTELVLKGKDIELLLLKKQVSEKLSHLSDIEITNLPSTVSKTITFVPGSLELGCLDDLDNIKKKEEKKEPEIKLRSVETQTEGLSRSSRSVQTERKQTPEPAPEPLPEPLPEPQPQASQVTVNIVNDDKPIVTDSNDTSDKSVSMRSRSLQLQSQSSKEDTPDTSVPEPMSSPVPRRHRRRRERIKPVEVSVRPTTYNLVATATAPILTYSSSIDDSFPN